MEFYDLIRSRISVRSYHPDKKVSKEVLYRILEAGRIAPSAANRQPWKFVVVSTAEMLNKVRACYQKTWFNNAPHVLVVKGDKSTAWTRSYDGYNSLETDLTIAMDHLILAAENEGVGTCWIAAFDPKILYEVLNLTENEEIYAVTPLGYPEDDFDLNKTKVRKDIDNIVEFL